MFSSTTLYFPLCVLVLKVKGWGRESSDRQVGQSFYISAQRNWAAGLQRTLCDIHDPCLNTAEACISQQKNVHKEKRS